MVGKPLAMIGTTLIMVIKIKIGKTLIITGTT